MGGEPGGLDADQRRSKQPFAMHPELFGGGVRRNVENPNPSELPEHVFLPIF